MKNKSKTKRNPSGMQKKPRVSGAGGYFSRYIKHGMKKGKKGKS